MSFDVACQFTFRFGLFSTVRSMTPLLRRKICTFCAEYEP